MARVSHSTVSRALANSPLVNNRTSQVIQGIASEHGYQVNQVARNLKNRSTHTIGLVVPEFSNPYYPKLIQAIANQTAHSGFSLQLQLSGTRQENERICLTSLRENRVDGILLITAEQGIVDGPYVDQLVQSGFPIVTLGWVPDAEHLDIVTGDDAHGGRELAHYLYTLGHRNFAIIGKAAHRGPFDRNEGFINKLGELGCTLPQENIYLADTLATVHAALTRLLKSSPLPTAIFAYQDSIAMLVYEALSTLGVHVPGQVSVVGFDDLDFTKYITPRLTTVGAHIEPLANAFVERLLSRILTPKEMCEPRCIVVKPSLIIGDSCAPPPRV